MMKRLALVLLAAAGCGGSFTELEGVYNIDTWTRNDASCDAEGGSILEDQTDHSIFVQQQEFLGQEFLAGVLCTDVADCQDKAAEDTLFLGAFNFDKGSDSDGWTGGIVFAGGGGADCSGGVTDIVMTSSGDSIRIESRTRQSVPFPPGPDGFCDSEDAKDAAEGQPCTELEVVTATFADDL